MNIAILSFYSGINNRGAERWVTDISSRLSTSHNVTVYQNSSFIREVPYKIIITNLSYRERSLGQIARRFFLDYKSLKVLQFTFKILKDFIKGDYDIVIPIDGGWEPAIIRIVSWFQRKRMIIVGHAGIGCDDANNLWSFPDVFVALSSYAQKWAKRINPFVKTVYIPNGVDMERFTSSGNKADLHFKNSYPVALCVGALEEGKRFDLIIKAVSKLGKLNLLICGKGEMEKELRVIGNELLNDRFLIRHFDFEKISDVYRASNILISASLSQYSFEMVILEAMACGLPVVANNDPIRAEIVGSGGFLVDVTNIDKFANAIKKALKINCGEKPIVQAKKFSWDGIVKKYEELFNNSLIQ